MDLTKLKNFSLPQILTSDYDFEWKSRFEFGRKSKSENRKQIHFEWKNSFF